MVGLLCKYYTHIHTHAHTQACINTYMQLFYIMIRTSSLHTPMYVISLDKMMP